MQTSQVAFLTLTVLCCGATYLAARRSDSTHARELAALDERLAGLAAKLEHAPPRSNPEPQPGTVELAQLRSRLERLESSAERRAVAIAEPSVPVPATQPATGGSDDAEKHARERAEFEELYAKLLGPDFDLHGTHEEQERFWELVRGTKVVDEILAELQAKVEGDPQNLDARMDLARAYVAKLMTVPGGPEQGLWGERAEEQWRTVAESDPYRWDAHFSLGNNYSYYPSFMGKTGAAITSLEHALELQKQLPPEPAHVQTYLSLARMYVRKGKVAEARALLESGLALHPGNAQLQAALSELPE